MRAARLDEWQKQQLEPGQLGKKYGKGASVELPPIRGCSHVRRLVKRDGRGASKGRDAIRCRQACCTATTATCRLANPAPSMSPSPSLSHSHSRYKTPSFFSQTPPIYAYPEATRIPMVSLHTRSPKLASLLKLRIITLTITISPVL